MALFIISCCAKAASAPFPSRDATAAYLENTGNRYYSENKIDSALMCFSLIAENPELKGSTPAIRAKAYNKCGHLYYLTHNISSAYQCFLKAQSQGVPFESNRAKIYLSVIYSYLGDYPKALSYYKETRDWSEKNKDYINYLTIHNNILNSAFLNDQLISVVDMMESFRRIKDLPDGVLSRTVSAVNDGMLDIVGKRYDSAISNFEKAYRELQDTDGYIPYRVSIYENMAKAYSLREDFANAIAMLEKANDIAADNNLLEMKTQNLKLMSEYYEKAGLSEMAMDARNSYLGLKDSLLNQTSVNSIYNLQSSHEIGKVRDELFKANVERKMQRKMLWASLGFLVLLSVLVLFLLIKNNTIKRNNRALYLKNTELMGLASPAAEQNETDSGADLPAHAHDEGTASEKADQRISRAMADEILAAVREVMSRPEAFCNAGFSLDQLSRMAGYNSKYVSTVINRRIGKSFRQWLAECRVRQACVIMQDNAGADDISIEAIADQVGIRSRSNFSSTFKQITGMSPKEFQRQAQKTKT